MEGNVISGWCISQKQGEEESIEGYLKAWDAIKQLDVGPSHVNLAAEIANRFMSGGHYANMVHFVNNLDDTFLQKLKENEKFARSLIALRMTQRKYTEVFTLLQNGRFSNKDGLLEIWDEAHYREWEERMGKPLNALLRYRIRQRFLPPQHICPNGTRPTTRLPDQALKILKEWLMQHPNNPYPSKADKDLLMKNSGLSLSQVKTWFANARRRLRLKKEKRNKRRSAEADGDLTCSEQDGSSSSPEDIFSEDTVPVVKEEVVTTQPLSEDWMTREPSDNHNGDINPYPQNCADQFSTPLLSDQVGLSRDTHEQKRIKWPEHARQPVYPTATVTSHIPFFQPRHVSASYIPNHQMAQTSEYLKAMAGMCEEISPSTYQLGTPRPPKHSMCQALADLQSMQPSRTPTCGLLQDDAYRCLSYHKQQGDPLYPPFRGGSFMSEALDNRQKKWYQGHENSSLVRSYSVSAPPALSNLSTFSSHQPIQHQTNSMMPGMLRDQLQDPSWTSYQSTYNGRCYMCCRGQCSGCQPAVTSHQSETASVALTSFGVPVMGTSIRLPMMHEQPLPSIHHMTSQSSIPEQSYRQWTAVKRTNEQQRIPLPAFHTSFDVLKLPSPPLPLTHHVFDQGRTEASVDHTDGSGCASLRHTEVQTNRPVVSSLRRRHRSQPETSSEPLEPHFFLKSSSPTQVDSVPSAQSKVQSDCHRPFRKRSASIESEAWKIKHMKTTTYQSNLSTDTAKIFSKGPDQGNVDTEIQGDMEKVCTAKQLSPPDAHMHQKTKSLMIVDAEEPLSSSSPDPSLTTHPQANPTESREGMKEIAQVLLDLSTKGSKSS